MSRQQILGAMAAAGEAAYGVGLLNRRLQGALQAEVAGLLDGPVPVADYQRSLAYLNRAPGWGLQALRRYFFRPMMTLSEVEPLAHLFIQDQLRGGPLLLYSQSLNLLARDAGALAGIRHKLFGEDAGASTANPCGRMVSTYCRKQCLSCPRWRVSLLPGRATPCPMCNYLHAISVSPM
jgi:hypothetical protein